MKLSNSQIIKINDLFNETNTIFHHPFMDLIFLDIEDAWIIGDSIRDLILFQNPQINEYIYYLQVKKKDSIYPWLSKMAENEINFEIENKVNTYNKDDVLFKIHVDMQLIGIEKEVVFIIGTKSPKKFIETNLAVATSLIGLDVANLFIYEKDKSREIKIVKEIWRHSLYKKDIINKNVTILKQDWMRNSSNYTYFEFYLNKLYKKLNILKFT